MKQQPCRLYAIVADDAPVAVVFRRKPRRWWHLLAWNLAEPAVTSGAWFKGRLYPRRSNLSPDGRLLCYFAMKGNPFSRWHQYWAVSRPPWLTALAAWANSGTWATGCRFDRDGCLTIAGTVTHARPFHGEYPGEVCLEGVDTNWDEARFSLEREHGWHPAARPELWLAETGSRGVQDPSAVQVLEKEDPRGSGTLALVSPGCEFSRPGTEGVVVEYLFSPAGGGGPMRLPDVAWADWSHDGRLLLATRTGSLEIYEARTSTPRRIWCQDLDALTPSPSPAPDWASRW